MKYFILFLFSVLISSVSQVILKNSAGEHHENKLKDYLNIKVILAYGIFFVSSLLTVLAYKYVPLSLGPVLEASGYIYVAALSYIFLKEKIGKRKMIGLIMILAGILISNISL